MEINYKDTMNDKQKQMCLEVSNLLKKYNINSIEEIQGCTLAEFLAKQHPDRYDNSIYQNTDELKQIFAIVNKKENVAIFINLNKDENSKLEVGDFAEQDLQTYKIKLAPELENEIKGQYEKMCNGTTMAKDFEKEKNKIFKGDLDSLEKTATIPFYLKGEAKKIISAKIDKENDENGISRDEREQIEGEQLQDKEENDQNLPTDVINACKKLNISKIKGYFYVDANQLRKKIDNNLVNKDGEKVLIIETPSEKIDGPNRYYGMQDEKMVLYGNEDQAVKEVTGNVTKMGKVIEPLRIKEDKTIKYQDSDGLVINEQIDDNSELSVQEANNYREEMIEILEEYSKEIELIENDNSLNDKQKRQKIYEKGNEFYIRADKIADNYDIKPFDTDSVMDKIEKHEKEEIDEEGYNDNKNEEEYDDRGLPRVPGKIYRGD